MPNFVIVNEHRVINLDMVEEIHLSDDGKCVILDMADGSISFIRDEKEAVSFWGAILNMPDRTGSFGRFVGADRKAK